MFATGSVATVKVPALALALCKLAGSAAQVKIVTSAPGRIMLSLARSYDAAAWRDFQAAGVEVFVDEDEWTGYRDIRKDLVLHIKLRRWADLGVVAPCSANTLAKLANGMSDNLATCCLRAWDPAKPLIVAPAMNTVMWEHPATKLHLDTLQSWGFHIIPPASKTLACNDVGRGALAAEGDILQCVQVCNAPRSRDTAPSHPRDPRCACRCTTRVARVTCPRPRLWRMRLAQGLTVGTRARAQALLSRAGSGTCQADVGDPTESDRAPFHNKWLPSHSGVGNWRARGFAEFTG